MDKKTKTSEVTSFRLPPELKEEWEELIDYLGEDRKVQEKIATIIYFP